MSIRMDTSSTTQMAELMVKHWISCGASLTKLVWSPTCWSRVGKTIWRRFFELGWEKLPNWIVCSFIENKGLFLSENVDDIEIAGKKLPCGRNWWNMWTLTNPHHFLTMYTWDALSVNANRMKQLLNNLRRCLNQVFLPLQRQKLPGWEKLHAQTAAWSYDMEGHAQKMRWAIQLENCQKFAHKLSWNACTWARIGRPDIRWSVNNKHARSVTKKWTQACDRRLARLISYIHHTNDFRQCCHVGHTAQHCRLGLFQDSDLAGDLEEISFRRCLLYFWK